MSTINPYLNFTGDCEEAFEFYHAALGGDLTEPGSGKKTVVHLLAGLVESALRPGIDRFVEPDHP